MSCWGQIARDRVPSHLGARGLGYDPQGVGAGGEGTGPRASRGTFFGHVVEIEVRKMEFCREVTVDSLSLSKKP